MLLVITFLMGIGNFALQRAVLGRIGPAMQSMPAFVRTHAGTILFVAEFALLVGAMWQVATGRAGWAFAYVGYTTMNLAVGWSVLRRPD